MKGVSILTLGDAGSFSHAASLEIGRLVGVSQILFSSSNTEVVRETLAHLNTYLGVVPFETAAGGLVPEVIKEIIAGLDKKPHIFAEHVMPIEQCFASMGGLAKVKTIISHPQALLQCQKFLAKLSAENPDLVIRGDPNSSTSKAAKLASEDQTIAAICSRLAAELCGLRHIKLGVQDFTNNQTRFIVIHRNDQPVPTGSDRTTLLYSVANNPGGLWKAIGVFSRRGLNLSSQHSVPTNLSLGSYVMLTEIEAHRSDTAMQRALRALREKTVPDSMYILGSYPRHNNPSLQSQSTQLVKRAT